MKGAQVYGLAAALVSVNSVGALQRILGGTSKDEISFANLDGQKQTILNYAYSFSTFGVVILLGLVAHLCYLMSAKNDTQKKVFAEVSSKKVNRLPEGEMNYHDPAAPVAGPESSRGYNGVARRNEAIFEETKRDERGRSPSSPGSPARDGGRIEMAQRSESPKRKLVVTSSGHLKRHAPIRSDVGNSSPAPSREQLPPIAPVPDAGDRPRRKLKMKMGEKGLTHFTES